MAATGGHDIGAALSRNRQVGEARAMQISAPGLAKLRRDFRRLAPETDKALRVKLTVAAQPIRDRARQSVRSRSGNLARRLRVRTTQTGVAIVDSAPYANVIHWGGTTGPGHRPNVPWSGSVFIKPELFVTHALDREEPRVFEAMGAAVEQAARRTGWHGGSF